MRKQLSLKAKVCLNRKDLQQILKKHRKLELKVKDLDLQMQNLQCDAMNINKIGSVRIDDPSQFVKALEPCNQIPKQEDDALISELNMDVKYIGYMTICSSVLTSGKRVEAIQNIVAKKSALGGPTLDVINLESYLLKIGSLVHRQAKYEYSSESISAASKEDFLKSLSFFYDNIRNESCMLFFTGHGLQNTSLVFETAVENYYMTYDDVIDIWKSRTNRKNLHFFILLDCCYSGSWVVQLFKRGDFREVSIQASSTYSEKSNDLGSEIGSLFTTMITVENGLQIKNLQLNLADPAVKSILKTQSPMSFCSRWGMSAKIFSKIGINSWNDLMLASNYKTKILKSTKEVITTVKEIPQDGEPCMEFLVIIIESNRLIIQGEIVIDETTPFQKNSLLSVIKQEFPSQMLGRVSVWTKKDEKETRGIFFREFKSKVFAFEIDNNSLISSKCLIKKWILEQESSNSPKIEILLEALALLTEINKNNLLKDEEIVEELGEEIDFESLKCNVECPLESLSFSGENMQGTIQLLVDLIESGQLSLKSLKLPNLNFKLTNLENIRNVDSISVVIDSTTDRDFMSTIMNVLPTFLYKSIEINFLEIVHAHLVVWPSLFANFVVCTELKLLSIINISVAYFDDLFSAINESLSLESISLINCDFKASQSNSLLKSIFRKERITSISFINSNINTILEPHPKTTYLNLSRNTLINSNVKPLFKCSFISRHTLDLSFNLLNVNILSDVSAYLRDNKLCNELNLTGNSFHNSIVNVARLNILYKCTVTILNLSEIRLSHCDTKNLSSLLCKAKNLKHLNLSRCSLTSDQILELTEFFKDNNSVSICSLDISYNKINKEDLFNTLKRRTVNCKTIQTLYMIDCIDIVANTPIKAEGFFSASNLRNINYSGWKATGGIDVGNKVSKDLLRVILKEFTFCLACSLNLKNLNLDLLEIDDQAAKHIMLPNSSKFLKLFEMTEESMTKIQALLSQAQAIDSHDSNSNLCGSWLSKLKLKTTKLDQTQCSTQSISHSLNMLIAEEVDESAASFLAEVSCKKYCIHNSLIKPVSAKNKLSASTNGSKILSSLSVELLRVLEMRQFFQAYKIEYIRKGYHSSLNSHTKCLSLDRNCFDADQLLKANFISLEILELNALYLKAHKSLILAFIEKNKSIKVLIIMNSEINSREINAICSILSTLRTSIEELHLINSFIDSREVKPLFTQLLLCPNFHTINLSGNTISKCLIIDFVCQHNAISSLILRNCNLTQREVFIVLSILHKKPMQTIDISGFCADNFAVRHNISQSKWDSIDRTRDYAVEIFYSSLYFKNQYNDYLQLLHLNRIDFDSSGCLVNSIIRSCECIPTVIVTRCLNENSFMKNLQILTRLVKVKRLILSGNLMSLPNTKFLIEYIKNQIKLKNDSMFIDISMTNLEDQCFEVLFDYVYAQINSNELRLDISYNMLAEASWKLINSLDLDKIMTFSNMKGAFSAELNNNQMREDYFRAPITSLSYSTMNLFDIERYERCWNSMLCGHNDCVCMILKLTDDLIVTCSDDNTIKIWQLSSSRCINTYIGHTDNIFSIEKINDDLIVSGSFDETIKLWRISTGECLKTMIGHQGKVFGIIKMSDETVISCSEDKTIKTWNINTGECLSSFYCETDDRIALLKVNDSVIASGTLVVRLWSPDDGEFFSEFIGHEACINSLIMITDFVLASGSNDKTIKLWKINTGICIKTLTSDSCVYVLLKMSGNLIVSGCQNKTIILWDISTGECLQNFNNHSNYIWSLAKLNDSLFLSGASDNTIRINKIETAHTIENSEFNFSQKFDMSGHLNLIIELVMINDYMIASASIDYTIKIWNIKLKKCLKTLIGHNSYIISLICVTEDLIVSASEDYIKVWEISTACCLKSITVAKAISLSKLSDCLIACGTDHRIEIYELNDYKCIANLNTLRAMCFLNIGDSLICGTHDLSIKVWQISNSKFLYSSNAHSEMISCLMQLENDKFLSGSTDKTIKLWSLSIGKCLKTFNHNLTSRFFLLKISNEKIIFYNEEQTQLLDLKTGDCHDTLIELGICIKMIKINDSLLKTSFNNASIRIYENFFDTEAQEISNKEDSYEVLSAKEEIEENRSIEIDIEYEIQVESVENQDESFKKEESNDYE